MSHDTEEARLNSSIFRAHLKQIIQPHLGNDEALSLAFEIGINENGFGIFGKRHKGFFAAEDVIAAVGFGGGARSFGSKSKVYSITQRCMEPNRFDHLGQIFLFLLFTTCQQNGSGKQDGVITASEPARSPNAISSTASAPVTAERSPNPP